jgi:hypothetical protein
LSPLMEMEESVQEINMEERERAEREGSIRER